MNSFVHWREALQSWRIPDDILASAPESPYIHPVELFDVSALDVIPDSPSHAAARAGLGASLLDIGCGGGRAAFAWWKHFWGIERPTSPSAEDAAQCMRDLGYDVHMELHEPAATPAPVDEDTAVRFQRIRLCLPADRDEDVRAFMRTQPPRARTNVTLWWDVR